MVTFETRWRVDGAAAVSFFPFLPSPPKLTGLLADAAHIMLRKSQGFSCSRSSYSREIGRMACSASMWIICFVRSTSGDSSKSIMGVSSFGWGR